MDAEARKQRRADNRSQRQECPCLRIVRGRGARPAALLERIQFDRNAATRPEDARN